MTRERADEDSGSASMRVKANEAGKGRAGHSASLGVAAFAAIGAALLLACSPPPPKPLPGGPPPEYEAPRDYKGNLGGAPAPAEAQEPAGDDEPPPPPVPATTSTTAPSAPP